MPGAARYPATTNSVIIQYSGTIRIRRFSRNIQGVSLADVITMMKPLTTKNMSTPEAKFSVPANQSLNQAS